MWKEGSCALEARDVSYSPLSATGSTIVPINLTKIQRSAVCIHIFYVYWASLQVSKPCTLLYTLSGSAQCMHESVQNIHNVRYSSSPLVKVVISHQELKCVSRINRLRVALCAFQCIRLVKEESILTTCVVWCFLRRTGAIQTIPICVILAYNFCFEENAYVQFGLESPNPSLHTPM